MDTTRFRLMLLQGVVDPCFASCYHKKDSKAPDYTPMANASAEAAQISAQLGREQMAQAQAQYDREMAVTQPVIDAQLGLMKQQQQQGDDYYNYMVSRQRPVEDALNNEAMHYNSAQDDAERRLITGSDADVYAARQGDIDNQVGTALADVRSGQANTTNQMIRQAMRYGWSPDKLAQMAGSQGMTMASQQAAAANAARNTGIANTRGLMMQDRQMRQADLAREWGKKMDVAGLYRGLTGASQGAYGLSLGAGNNAVGNSMTPANQLLGANQAAAGTIMQGKGLQIQGLGSILNSETGIYNTKQQSSGNGLGTALGLAGGVVSKLAFSDRRVKENVVLVGEYANGLPAYEFNYIGDPVRYRGVMAQDVEAAFPEAVVRTEGGIMAVNYSRLGLSMERV